ncbi:MAG: hypothetical protein WCA10_25540 [Terracidiphilus sp.]
MFSARLSLLLFLLHAGLTLPASPQTQPRAEKLKSLTLQQLGEVTNIPDALRFVPGVNVVRVNGSRNWAVGIPGFGDPFSSSSTARR